MRLLILLVFVPFILAQGSLEEVYLWKGKNSSIGKTVQFPYPLIVTFYSTIPKNSSPLEKEINRFLQNPYLEGKTCGSQRSIISPMHVEKILPSQTKLTILKAYYKVEKINFFRKLILKFTSFKDLIFKGGPLMYFLLSNSKGEKFISNRIVISGVLSYMYQDKKGKGGRAKHIIEKLKNSNQRVIISFESSKEYNYKCGYKTPQGEVVVMDPQKELPLFVEETYKLITKLSSSYKFEKIRKLKQTIEVDLDENALGLLIINSSSLRIKNITIL